MGRRTDAADDTPSSVSVVMPAYNAAGTIERALDSVYAQTCDSIIEVIVVDDGSEDDTATIVREKFPDATLIQQQNQGSPTSRNVGVAAAGGEYVAFLDDDDEWFPEKTAVQMMCIRECPGLRMTIADCATDQEQVSSDRNAAEEVVLEAVTFADVFPEFPFHCGCSGWVFDRGLFEECGGFAPHMRRSQDAEWLWRALLKGFSIGFVAGPLYRYHAGRHRRSREEWAGMWKTYHEVLPPVVEEMAAQATRSPARLTQRQADQRVGAFYRSAAWNLWQWGLRHEARGCLETAADLSDARGPRALVERLAVWNPGLYRALSRLRPGALRGGGV